ncbi:hypothetical protein E2C01_084286 [Portunus trituberculatus]|uniref:Uncharacterized protein n=1 Tax=Portunus trituberculatus TaxID=210409 RepID=A0A5B7J724_PORTR|nr:hypothetical protein [Portunus trituberculatus]
MVRSASQIIAHGDSSKYLLQKSERQREIRGKENLTSCSKTGMHMSEYVCVYVHEPATRGKFLAVEKLLRWCKRGRHEEGGRRRTWEVVREGVVVACGGVRVVVKAAEGRVGQDRGCPGEVRERRVVRVDRELGPRQYPQERRARDKLVTSIRHARSHDDAWTSSTSNRRRGGG